VAPSASPQVGADWSQGGVFPLRVMRSAREMRA
jgi:hypothetical protein